VLILGNRSLEIVCAGTPGDGTMTFNR